MLRKEGRHDEAEELVRRVEEMKRKAHGGERPEDVFKHVRELGHEVERLRGEMAEIKDLLRELLRRLER